MWNRHLSSRFPKESFFLFGPRQVGKSTILAETASLFRLDLLEPKLQLAYTKNPDRLLNEIESAYSQNLDSSKLTAIIDEIQKVPALLDIVQMCMSKYPKLRWILTGSSARKIRKNHANLLGGRALYRSLHPLTQGELESDFRLDLALSFGTLPKIYDIALRGNSETAIEYLRSYVITYLNEEIKAEAIVRNLQGFQNFLEVAAAQFSEQINFSELAKETQVSYASAREYYNILEDTFLGFFLLPYLKSKRKRMSHQPKFYFFDNGVTRALNSTLRNSINPIEKGRLFEQWVIQEIFRINLYESKDWKLLFWRTSHGAEVDLIIERGREIKCAIEIKFKTTLSPSDLSGISAFRESGFSKVPCFLVAPIESTQTLNGVEILPPLELLKKLKLSF